jgi:hypothetical protein
MHTSTQAQHGVPRQRLQNISRRTGPRRATLALSRPSWWRCAGTQGALGLQQAAFTMLACMMAGNADNRAKAVKAGAVEAVVAAMQGHREHTEMQHAACLTLFDIATENAASNKLPCLAADSALVDTGLAASNASTPPVAQCTIFATRSTRCLPRLSRPLLPPPTNKLHAYIAACVHEVQVPPAPPETGYDTVAAVKRCSTAARNVPKKTGRYKRVCARACVGHATTQALAVHEAQGRGRKHDLRSND